MRTIKVTEKQLKMLMEQSQEQRLDLPEESDDTTVWNTVEKLLGDAIEDKDWDKVNQAFGIAVNRSTKDMEHSVMDDDHDQNMERNFGVEDDEEPYYHDDELNEGIEKMKSDFKKFI